MMNQRDRRRRIGPPAHQERFDLTGDFLAVVLLIAALFLLVWARPADAAAPTLTVDLPVTMLLPSKNVDGSALTDLGSIVIEHAVSGDWSAAERTVITTDVPAAPAPSDELAVTLSAVVASGDVVSIRAQAVDLAGNASGWSNVVTKGPFIVTDNTVPRPGQIEVGEAVIVSCPVGWTCTVSSAQ